MYEYDNLTSNDWLHINMQHDLDKEMRWLAKDGEDRLEDGEEECSDSSAGQSS